MFENIFEKELNLMNSRWRELATKGLNNAPAYFFIVPASSTGKYHPTYALGEGGLIRHEKGAIHIGLDLLQCGVPFNFGDYPELKEIEEDIVSILIYTLMFHDVNKQGDNIEAVGYTHKQHPVFGSAYVYSNLLGEDINPIALEMINFGILNHMGKWTYKPNSETEFIGMQKFESPKKNYLNRWCELIHLADYIASRKYLECNFDRID